MTQRSLIKEYDPRRKIYGAVKKFYSCFSDMQVHVFSLWKNNYLIIKALCLFRKIAANSYCSVNKLTLLLY